MPFCVICLSNVEVKNEKGYCSSCEKYIKDEEKHRLSMGANPAKWDSTGEIYLLEGKGWAISPTGRSFVLGEEKEILEVINSRKIPTGINKTRQKEYERIFKILEEKDNESGRNKGGDNKSDIRAPKIGKRSSQRVRSVRNTGNRDKHFRPTKAPKRVTIPRTRLKK